MIKCGLLFCVLCVLLLFSQDHAPGHSADGRSALRISSFTIRVSAVAGRAYNFAAEPYCACRCSRRFTVMVSFFSRIFAASSSETGFMVLTAYVFPAGF